MPLYVYQVVTDDGTEGEVFEALQGLSEPPLTVHPETGRPVRRLLSAPNAIRKVGPGVPSDGRLDRLGFTKYERSGDGTYEKTAGRGPDTLSGGDG
ncbi:MAG: FmdB family zinc ribbon protein [Gemmataceae bacterium]